MACQSREPPQMCCRLSVFDMDTDGDIHKVFLWNRICANATLNSDWKTYLANRRRIEDFDRQFSPVYNASQFVPAYVRRARLPSIKLQTLAPVQTNTSEATCCIETPGSTSEHDDSQLNQSDISTRQASSILSDDSSLLLEIPKRKPTSRPLLRRPTIGKASPLLASSSYFDELSAITDEFKMFIQDEHIDTFKFYLYKYPLLMTMADTGSDSSISDDKRSGSIVSPLTFMLSHKSKLDVRLAEIEEKMSALERAYREDKCRLETELRSSVFDPTTYPWNVYNERHFRRKDSQDAAIKMIHIYKKTKQ